MIIGIDLGTSNCAVAYADPAHGSAAAVRDFSIPQLQRSGEVAARPLLPSFIYLPAADELPAGATRLPWGDLPERVTGEFARWQGSRVPGRLVSSAKSWLCHPSVDRSAAILPWGSSADVRKISPVEASAEYLRHIGQAWNSSHPEMLIGDQEIVITVPASFDEVARGLTVKAAREAGFSKFTLIEEPEAAFYDFTANHRSQLAEALEGVRLVLVVDVGGGTSDFTLVRVAMRENGSELERIAVGEHLMLGGDNMDAALARQAEERLAAGGRKLNATQWMQLTQSAREAKERLLGSKAPDSAPLSVAGEGSRLIGGALSTRVTREEVERLVVEGFFPASSPSEATRRSGRAALQELGLPYASDPAITRHIADFLRKHAESAFAALGRPRTHALPRPDAVLLNGGVFNSTALATRVVDVISTWWTDQPPVRVLAHSSLDLAVARGAAYYGLVRHGLGARIGGGAARSLYVGLGSRDSKAPRQAICVIPRGQEEGNTVELRDKPFQLAVGKPVQFPLYSSNEDRFDRAGALVALTDDLAPLPPIQTVLKGRNAGVIPVFLRATLTEIGALEISCVSTETNEQWRLEFDLRGAAAESEAMSVTESMPPRYSEARQSIEYIFSAKAKQPKTTLPAAMLPKDVRQLWTSLERALGPRAQWSLPVLRELWTSLFAGAPRRRRSPDHERVFLQLLGYALRPGFGYALDEWRCGETFQLFPQLVEFHKEKPNWTEFWVLWRRISAGLSETQQLEIWNYLQPHLAARLSGRDAKTAPRGKGVQPEGLDEMVKVAASLEHLPIEEKIRLGEWILPKVIGGEAAVGGPWAWALGRLGARAPIRASAHKVVPPPTAERWADELLRSDWSKVEAASFAVAQITRLTGDRARDVSSGLRERSIAKLTQVSAPERWTNGLIQVLEIESSDQARALGDALPSGLQLA